MKTRNALLILSLVGDFSATNARERRRAPQQRDTETHHRRRLKKSYTPSKEKEHNASPQSASKSKKLDERYDLGKGRKKKEPKDTDCPTLQKIKQPTEAPSPISRSMKKSKTFSKGNEHKLSLPVIPPSQSASKSKKLDDRYDIGKGRKRKVPKQSKEKKDCPSIQETEPPIETASPISSPILPPSPVASPVTTTAPAPFIVPTTSPVDSPTRAPSIPEAENPIPTAAPQPGVTLTPTRAATTAPTLVATIPPTRAATEAPTIGVTIPNPTPAERFDTTLGLDDVADRFKPFFMNAATAWDSIIVGDMSDVVVDNTILNSPNLKCDPASLPDVIDDIFICASVEPIDGPLGILGTAGPSFFRFGDTITATVGFMNFDVADMDLQLEAGTLESLIQHEMAHVYGFGTLWALNGLTEEAALCPYKYDSRASEEYRTISGCDASIPIETESGIGTQCLHWDESCFLGELMTGSSTDGLELSVLTIASLDDLGYTVDYSRADPFDASKMSPDCVCNRRQLRGTGSDEPAIYSYRSESDVDKRSNRFDQKPRLSDEGHRIARAHGVSILNANHQWKKAYLRDEEAERYIGDQIIVVLYMENGYKHTVMVTR